MVRHRGTRFDRRDLLALTAALIAACRASPEEILPTSQPIDAAEIDALLRARVFFGHQSVGENILEGVRAIIAPRTLAWVDAKVGTNERPETKLDAFAEAMTKGAGRDARLAFVKLCYIDFNERTDVVALFQRYKKTLGELQNACAGTTFVHFTAPLTTVSSGPKAWVKKRLGASVWGEVENERRHAYSELLRAEYAGKEPLFDLADVEAGGSARPHRFDLKGKTVPMLAEGYTDDGGHLNGAGRRVVAESLLRYLTKVPLRGS